MKANGADHTPRRESANARTHAPIVQTEAITHNGQSGNSTSTPAKISSSARTAALASSPTIAPRSPAPPAGRNAPAARGGDVAGNGAADAGEATVTPAPPPPTKSPR